MIKKLFSVIPRRVVILTAGFNALVLVGVVVNSLIATPIYRSEAMLIPKSSFSSTPSNFGGGAEAALIGLGLGAGSSKLTAFESILKSPAVIDHFSVTSGLRGAVQKEYIEDYRDLVNNIVLIDFRKDGTVGVAVEDKSPVVAQKYAQAYVESFENIVRGIAERNAESQKVGLKSVLENARANYESNQDRVKASRVDESILRSDPSILATTAATIEEKILKSQMLMAQLGTAFTPSSPDMIAAKAAHAQLLAAKEQLMRAVPKVAGGLSNTSFPLDSVIARQSAVIVSAYTQAQEKVLVDSILSSFPYTVAQSPTLPEKRIRPQRRKMIAFAIMVQALLTGAFLGVYGSVLFQRRNAVNNA